MSEKKFKTDGDREDVIISTVFIIFFVLLRISLIRNFILEISDSEVLNGISFASWVLGIIGIIYFFKGITRSHERTPEGRAEILRKKQDYIKWKKGLERDAPMGYSTPQDKAICPDCNNIMGTGIKYIHPCPRCGYGGCPKFNRDRKS